MNDSDDKIIKKLLDQEYEEITPRAEFIRSLDRTLSTQLKQRKKTTLYVPALASLGSILIIFLLSISFINHNQANSATSNERVLIYTTHFTEAYIHSHEGEKTEHNTRNISLVANYLSEQLNDLSISTIHEKTNALQITEQQNVDFSYAYEVMRPILKELVTSNKHIDVVIDLHRDSAERIATTTSIEGKEAARLMFIIEDSHDDAQSNLRFAKELHDRIETIYPGLSRGVISKKSFQGHVKHYNQDLHGQAILLEVGGDENTIEEANYTIDLFAPIVAEYLKEQ
ncbi:stage II sporulation protein P [Alkalihalobacillus pseudalcaliphilus]|uniref:stage II sporulation protein P n=1 Tax=Alkalihalobacillus pseudalcaliphilus TaxID=79884 RepID=UPI00069FDA6B|nr:stage II sporulation protein P [Alkalihalobacillus pseudalcaliphilus]